MDWGLVVTIIIGGFTMASVIVGALRGQRRRDKEHAKTARDEISKKLSDGYEKLHDRITAEINKLREEIDACDMGREESLREAMKDVEGKLEKKVGADLFQQALDFMKETVKAVKEDNVRVVGEIKKETATALKVIGDKVDRLKVA